MISLTIVGSTVFIIFY